MKRTENVELTVMCLIRNGDEYLLQDRRKTTGALPCREGMWNRESQLSKRLSGK